MSAPAAGMLVHPHAERQFVVSGVADRAVEPAQHVLQQLRALNPRLGMRHLPLLDAFAVTVTWADDDPRRAAVQAQDADGLLTGQNEDGIDGLTRQDQTDIACVLPIQLRQDDIPGYVAQRLRSHSLASIRQMAIAADAHNAQQAFVNAQPVIDKAMNLAETVIANRAAPTVFMNDTEARTTRNSDLALAPVERRS